jgi:hypothetical protein
MTTVNAAKRHVRRRVVEVRGVVVRHPNGTHLGGMLVLRDVTDEKSFESRSRSGPASKSESNNEYFKQILDQMPQVRLADPASGLVADTGPDGLDHHATGLARLLQQPVVRLSLIR